jgi:hypothetical protein
VNQALERAGERLLRSLVSVGWTPTRWPGSACGTLILEVEGRRSGRLQSTLVTWVEYDGARYLVSMRRPEPGWVSNMRAADGYVALRHGGRRNRVRLEELPTNRRARVLRAWYGWTARSPVPRRHFGLPRNAGVEEFERVAAEHPVFRILPARTVAAEVAAAHLVTRDVDPSAVRDLLDDAPRASVAFVDHDAVELLPVRAGFGGDTHLFALLADGAPELQGREVVLVRDDGAYWFELRGISVRGVARHVDPPAPEGGERLTWYAIEPRRVLAWDYEAIRYA